MNKVLAILGAVVLITVGALFFFAGFYMGNTTSFGSSSQTEVFVKNSEDKKITLQEINAKIAAQSTDISNKVMKIISDSADNISDSVSKVATKIKHREISQMSADSLLKEIIASHSYHDDCSTEKTEKSLKSPSPYPKNGMQGKKAVFIGYFKDNIALQIQQLLINKGYKIHVEQSKTCLGESFIFAGPFKKKENADKLANWLKEHDFSEARVVNITQESVENTLADSMDDDSTIPDNEEEEIPEIDKGELQNLTSTENTVESTASNSIVDPRTVLLQPGQIPTNQAPLMNQMNNFQ